MPERWERVGYVTRSYESDRVWVPVAPDTDEEAWLHAGPLRRARAWLAEALIEPGERFRWRKVSDNEWWLEVPA